MTKYNVSYKKNEVYQAISVFAEDAETAKAYFKEYKPEAEFIGICIDQDENKPGKPFITVPECWTPAEEKEETTRTEEEIKADIIAYFEENEETFNDCIEELDSYNGYLGDDRYYPMYEFDEFMEGLTPSEVLQRTFYGGDEDTKNKDGIRGEFNLNRGYFFYNGYGNLCSTNYKDYSCHLDHYAIEQMRDYRRYIDTIDNIKELSALFDGWEEVSAEC